MMPRLVGDVREQLSMAGPSEGPKIFVFFENVFDHFVKLGPS